MRFFRGFVPNLAIALNIAMMIVIYLDRRNPMMGFLVGAPFVVLAAATCAASVITAVIVYSDWRKRGKHKKTPAKNSGKSVE